ncbi:hypothetical protein CgunFtcFv8_024562 [Champsocephalus gunnari]|uniref:Uncharacterized protein n=1 Tax=Champsocephalus gunnari TaxID=52237 RepID=A0AAN8DET2_CHAGU|nr:hypothetical protein CgunFtcFv8_024562 [Champsocephalus gunnari]
MEGYFSSVIMGDTTSHNSGLRRDGAYQRISTHVEMEPVSTFSLKKKFMNYFPMLDWKKFRTWRTDDFK